MVTGSPKDSDEVSVKLEKVAYLLEGYRQVNFPLPTPEEFLAILDGVIEIMKPHLHYLCRRTYGEQFPYIRLIDPKTKCICLELMEEHGAIEHVIVTRNGAIFLTWAMLFKELPKPRVTMLKKETVKSLNLTPRGWLQITLCTIQALRGKLNDDALGLRNRADDYGHTAYKLVGIEDRLSALL